MSYVTKKIFWVFFEIKLANIFHTIEIHHSVRIMLEFADILQMHLSKWRENPVKSGIIQSEFEFKNVLAAATNQDAFGHAC